MRFIGLIFGIPAMLFAIAGMNAYYYYHHDKRGTEEKHKDIVQIILIVIGIIVAIVVLSLFINGFDNGTAPSDAELNSCRNMSSTYYKCSWSIRENRCVCNQR